MVQGICFQFYRCSNVKYHYKYAVSACITELPIEQDEKYNHVHLLRKFDVHVTMHRDKFLIIKPTRCTNFSNLFFWNEILHVSDSSSIHRQEFFTVHTAMVYVVWQKSNETDFLLTMNFILFTNQGYSLQNSSLGQLHSDGGVVSIVRSSAGRLLLVYLSARRLRSSGYYPKY